VRSPWRLRFDLSAFLVGFVVDRLALAPILFPVLLSSTFTLIPPMHHATTDVLTINSVAQQNAKKPNTYLKKFLINMSVSTQCSINKNNALLTNQQECFHRGVHSGNDVFRRESGIIFEMLTAVSSPISCLWDVSQFSLIIYTESRKRHLTQEKT